MDNRFNMKIRYRDIKLSIPNQIRLDTINGIVEEYQKQGYVLTLRQLYYQLVSRDIIPNQQKEYSKLSTLLKEGRMAGIVDWNAIEDRLRAPECPSSWSSPSEIIETCLYSYERPRMEGQENYIEVWVEKDALSGVLSRVTKEYHIPIMVNRGYSSASAMHEAFKRFDEAINQRAQSCTVLYLGDHDPSGVDMIRDVEDRIQEFFIGTYSNPTCNFQIKPIALSMTQIKKYNPPPNPAKITDPRAGAYIAEHGGKSWEVDALKPEVLNRLLDSEIKKLIDFDLYRAQVEAEEVDKKVIRDIVKKLNK